MENETQYVKVSALEYAALLNLDKMIRIAISSPDTGEFLAGAMQALDQVRRDEGIAPIETSIAQPRITGVSDLAAALIDRAQRKEIE